MMMELSAYEHIRSGGAGFYEQKRGLIAVWGTEAVQFLDGLITNDMKTLEDGQQMLAAFPNAQGRLLAVVRVLRQGDRFLFETEGTTRKKVFDNLFRFTFAGDFFVEDLSEQFRFFEVFTSGDEPLLMCGLRTRFQSRGGSGLCVIAMDGAEEVIESLKASKAIEIDNEVYEVLRIENGVPKYGVDMDETTIVPELGLDSMISYNKGCYIGQEIIARIHFRGHVAKQLTGLISEPGAEATGFLPGAELKSTDGRNAGRITSVTYSPKLEKTIALGYVRFDNLSEGAKLLVNGQESLVENLPFL